MRETAGCCVVLLVVFSSAVGQSVNLLSSVGLSPGQAIGSLGATILSGDDVFPKVDSPAFLIGDLKQELHVSASDAKASLAIMRESEFSEFSISTLIKLGKRLPAPTTPAAKVLFSVKSKDGTKTYLKVQMVYVKRIGDAFCASCANVHIEVVWRGKNGVVTTTKFEDTSLFNKLAILDWNYLFVVFRSQGAGADIGQQETEIVVYLDCESRKQTVSTQFMDTPDPDSVVSICGTPGVDACDDVALQDFYLRQRGYVYSDSKKYCPASTCNIDCVEEQQLLNKEISDEKKRNANLGNDLSLCETLRISRYPRYCVTKNGSHVAVSTQYDETSSMSCVCQSHLRLSCTITGSSCTHNTVRYYLGEQFTDPDDSCNTCTCEASGDVTCERDVTSCKTPDCSAYENQRVISPPDRCCSVCEAEYCKDGTVYDPNAIDCTVYPTCENKKGVGCTTQTKSGCVCPRKYLFDYRNVCVQRKLCPCVERNSEQEVTKVLQSGKASFSGGRLCLCQKGKQRCY